MPYYKDIPPNETALAALFGEALQAIRSGGDTKNLDAWRAAFRKHVPLAMRSYVAAYLAMGALGGNAGRPQQGGRQDGRGRRDGRDRQGNDRQGGDRQGGERQGGDRKDARGSQGDKGRQDGRGRGEERKQSPKAAPAPQRREEPLPRNVLDPTLATMLFVGAGRKRRLRTRELAEIFISKGGLSREDIGEIRVLDNYSFVQVLSEVADRAIDALNGSEYSGRPLVVNRARKKEEAPEPPVAGVEGRDSPCDEGAFARREAAAEAREAADHGSGDRGSGDRGSHGLGSDDLASDDETLDEDYDDVSDDVSSDASDDASDDLSDDESGDEPGAYDEPRKDGDQDIDEESQR